ncbi:MAG: two-component system, sensor histidine kinase ChiS [Acidobacteriota bacterium]|nr:two-component system, sensor histidine kinase ChiS [Acidobacteriota bacterium]
MIKSKFSRIFVKHIRKLRIFFYSIILIFFGTILLFYFRATVSDRLIIESSIRRTEWTSSEHSPFFNWLIVKFKFEKVFEVEKINLDIERKMKEILAPIQMEIDEYKENKKVEMESGPLNIEKLAYEKIPAYLDDQRLTSLSLDNLNLIAEDKTPDEWKILEGDTKSNIQYFILRSKEDNRNELKSFVFFPAQLVDRDENNRFQLSLRMKRELVFSKFIEKYMWEILSQIPGAQQAFFIPMSGFVRICRNGSDNPVNYYRDKLNFRQDFADRLYFKPTIREKFHVTPLYVDAGGIGIVCTYSAAVMSDKWGIVGMIGLDVQVGRPGEQLLDEFHGLTLLPKNPQIDFCNAKDLDGNISEFKTKYNLLKWADKQGIVAFIEEKFGTPAVMVTTLNRFDFDERSQIIKPHSIGDKPVAMKTKNRIIYSLPLEDNKIAFFIFDKQQSMRQNILFISFLVTLLIIFTLLIRFVYDQMIKRVREEENKLELITHMHSSYVITDKFNHIQAYNKEFESLVEDKNAVGENFEEYLTKDSIKDLRFFLDSGKERFEFPVVLKTKSGSEKSAILINAQTSYHLDNKARISILIESENLESLVAEKYADRISHILKSPLHSILQIADQMRRKTAIPRYDDYFILLEAEIGGLKAEISRLLSMLKMEYKHTKPDYKKFDLTKLAKEIKDEYVPLIEIKKLGFNSNFAEGVSITADRNMIKVTIENILDNALKYTQSGSLSFYLYDSPEMVEIVIIDTGIGIPDDEKDLIFQKSHRGNHPVVLTSPGKGIGLHHCKNFIVLHNGRIDVESVVGKGSKFTIWIPKNLEGSIGE